MSIRQWIELLEIMVRVLVCLHTSVEPDHAKAAIEAIRNLRPLFSKNGPTSPC
jgi:hypothetical protein